MSKKILCCAFLWVGIAALPYGLHAMEKQTPIGEYDVCKYVRGAAEDISWRQTPMTAEEVARNESTFELIAQAVKDGTPLTLVEGFNGGTPQCGNPLREGSGLKSPFVIMSNDDALSLNLATPPPMPSRENGSLILSGDWEDSSFMGRILNNIFLAIIFHKDAAQYPSKLALQSLTSKLAPGGCLFLQATSYPDGCWKGTIQRDDDYELVYACGGCNWRVISYAPPHAVLEATRELEGQFAVSVVAVRASTDDKLYPHKEAAGNLCKRTCEKYGIPFAFYDNLDALLTRISEFGTISRKEYFAIKDSVGGDMLGFDETPIIIIQRTS
ncbi:MAG: hypothetical protein LBJ70_02480 [Holosporales bacterium]|jgi:hypothetical protein|nr:hypothetical protein [Holosporales bacterium]